jgi:hypothetical protein
VPLALAERGIEGAGLTQVSIGLGFVVYWLSTLFPLQRAMALGTWLLVGAVALAFAVDFVAGAWAVAMAVGARSASAGGMRASAGSAVAVVSGRGRALRVTNAADVVGELGGKAILGIVWTAAPAVRVELLMGGALALVGAEAVAGRRWRASRVSIRPVSRRDRERVRDLVSDGIRARWGVVAVADEAIVGVLLFEGGVVVEVEAIVVGHPDHERVTEALLEFLLGAFEYSAFALSAPVLDALPAGLRDELGFDRNGTRPAQLQCGGTLARGTREHAPTPTFIDTSRPPLAPAREPDTAVTPGGTPRPVPNFSVPRAATPRPACWRRSCRSSASGCWACR